MPDEKSKTYERIIDAAEETPCGVALLRVAVRTASAHSQRWPSGPAHA
mgnify:CR=1 FL=1